MKKRTGRILAALLALVLTMGCLAGCTTKSAISDSDSKKTEKKEGEKLTVGLALAALNTNAIFIDMKNEIQKKCDDAGYKLMTADLEEGTPKIIETLENFINGGCDVIIVQNAAEEACADLLKQAVDKGIVVGSYDYPSDICQYQVSGSNYDIGLTIGKTAGAWANEHPGSKKAAICGFSSLDFLIERAKGIKEGYLKECPDGEVVSELDAGYANEGVTAGENFLQACPDLQIVMGINDGGIMGVYEAFKAAGKSLNDNIGLFGCDASEDAIKAMKDEDMFIATMDMDLVNQVSLLYDRCVKTAQTGEINEKEKEVIYPCTPITIEDIKNNDKYN